MILLEFIGKKKVISNFTALLKVLLSNINYEMSILYYNLEFSNTLKNYIEWFSYVRI